MYVLCDQSLCAPAVMPAPDNYDYNDDDNRDDDVPENRYVATSQAQVTADRLGRRVKL